MSAPAAVSPVTAASQAHIEAHLGQARELGAALAAEIDDVAAFPARCRDGLARLSDPAFVAGLRVVAPGIGPVLGIRQPLSVAFRRGLAAGLRHAPPGRLLDAAMALAGDELRDLRWLAVWLAARAAPDDPGRAWLVFREVGRAGDDWITVDTLAVAMARAIVDEPERWTELDRLTASERLWERRLVGSTIATVPFAHRVRGRTPDVVDHGIALVGQLIGDAEPNVQKALSWSLRSLALVDGPRVAAFCRAQAEVAAGSGDGHRAWVLRDALAKLPPADAAAVRERLAGIRRRPGAPSTSAASATASAASATASAASATTTVPATTPASTTGRPAGLSAGRDRAGARATKIAADPTRRTEP